MLGKEEASEALPPSPTRALQSPMYLIPMLGRVGARELASLSLPPPNSFGILGTLVYGGFGVDPKCCISWGRSRSGSFSPI